MNTLKTWNPTRELRNIQDSLMGFFGRSPSPIDWIPTADSDWVPEIDVAEDEREYTLAADLPSVRKEDLHVCLQNGAIAISGNREKKSEGAGKVYHREERAYGKFARTFFLPENASSDLTKAEFRDGTLLVHIPKSKVSEPERKEIPVA